MATVQELNRMQLGNAVGAYIASYQKLYELSLNPADASQKEWEADTADHWTYEQLLVDSQDAQALVSVVDTQSEAQQEILDTNAAIIIAAFVANPVKEYIISSSAGWQIEYDEVNGVLIVTGLLPATNPENISGRLFHVKYDDGTIGTGVISLWEDQSGNGYDMTSAGALRPTITNPGDPVRFSGINGMNTASIPFSGTSDLTIFSVLNNTTTGAGIFIESSADFTANNSFAIKVNDATDGDMYLGDNGDVGIDSVYVNGAKSTAIMVRSGISRSNVGKGVGVYVDGSNFGFVSPSTSDNTNTFDNNVLYLGSRNNSSLFFTGDVYEIIIYERKLTDFEIGGIESYLRNKYSL